MTAHPPGSAPWYTADDPLPDDLSTLVAQIKRAAKARRYEAVHHPRLCPCDACCVRRYAEAHHRTALRAA